MNKKNVEFLKDQIKYTGFGEGYESQLNEKIGKELKEFQLLNRTEFGNDVVISRLDFSRSESSDLYFFNRYELTFRPEHSEQLMSQTFQIGKENNITQKEAYNLLSGRSVFKEYTKMEKDVILDKYIATGEKYNAWTQLNFKETDKYGNYKFQTFGDNYGFDLLQTLQKLPIAELGEETTAERLLQSLQKGNLQSVNLVENGQLQQHFVAANPRFKCIDVYDMNRNKLYQNQQQAKEQTNPQEPSLENKTPRPRVKKSGPSVS
ncbi:hypothetical protein [Pedobacter foliorum]|uniref:hypothetical protein n=1 Tax=Pedobacter foliorum TaxID=2739058 RepID=UPI001567ACE3|nr:hypothetical protein [Pedobacter foliorum]NRF41097.1 hypothetical protein [Pedobacter foliorum]